METISSKESVFNVLSQYKEELRDLSQCTSKAFSEIAEQYGRIYYDVIGKIIPEYYFCFTEGEKYDLITNILISPSVPASFPFSCFVSIIVSKSSLSKKENTSLLIIDLFEKFLKSRMTSLVDELTSIITDTGISALLHKEHISSTINSLFHIVDIVGNATPGRSVEFFSPSAFNLYMSNQLILVFISFYSDRDLVSFNDHISKFCILGNANIVSKSVIHIIELMLMKCIPSLPMESMIVRTNNKVIIQLLQKYVRFIPDIRYSDFSDYFVQTCLERSDYALFLPYIASIIFPPSVTQSRMPNLCTDIMFERIIYVIYYLYQRDNTVSITPDQWKTKPCFQLVSKLTIDFKSSTFPQKYTSSQQLRIASLLYCLLHLSVTFISSDPRDSSIINDLMQAVGKRLGEGSETFKNVVVGIASAVADIIAPSTHYDWPSHDVSHLDLIISKITNTPAVQTIVEEEDDIPVVINEIPVIQPVQKDSFYIDPEEIVDIFAEEQLTEIGRYADDETDAENEVINELPDIVSDSDDSFIAYDLTEDVLPSSSSNSREYRFLLEPLTDLTDKDLYIKQQAWRGLVGLVEEASVDVTQDVIRRVTSFVIEMNDMPGIPLFLEEYRRVLSVLIYRECHIAMQIVFDYLQKNGRSNITISKCVIVLQAIGDSANMLYFGDMNCKEYLMCFYMIYRNNNRKDTLLSISIEDKMNENTMKITNTTFKPSYYRKLSQKQTAERRAISVSPVSPQTNLYTAVSSDFLHPLITWCLRFPPRDSDCISYLLYTLSAMCQLPVLSSAFDDIYKDLCSLILRYRYDKQSTVRRGTIELFLATTKYNTCIKLGGECSEIQETESIVEWMKFVLCNDTDDGCRAVASMVLSQLK